MNLNIFKLFSLIILIIPSLNAQVNWQPGGWALACDFKGNDLTNAKTSGAECGARCASTQGCTHFTWTSYNDGTCWMKSGQVSQSNAVNTGDTSMTCGIMNYNPNPNPNPDPNPNNKFPNCQFRWGRDWQGDNTNYNPYDYVTFWIGSIDSNCPGANSKNPACTDFNPYWEGAMLAKVKALNKIPVLYGYIIAFEARNLQGLSDCDVHNGFPSLCEQGANFIRNNRNLILSRYNMHSKKIAEYLGASSTAIFLIEPDFWQYYGQPAQNGGGLSGQYMRDLYDAIAFEIKKNLPNALISWDISPWLSQSAMSAWWNFFKSSPNIDFIHTSGGQHHGELTTIQSHGLTWSYMSSLTGKKIIADSGYGVAGGASSNNWPWYIQSNVDARIRDGVIAESLTNSNQNPNYSPKLC